MKGRVKTRKNWWKKPFAVMLSATLLASSFTMAGMPEEVKAAEPAPGGVSDGLISWVDMTNSIILASGEVNGLDDLIAGNGSGYTNNECSDGKENDWCLYGNGNKATYNEAMFNFNGGASFSGKHFLRKQFNDQNPDKTGEVFSVQQGNTGSFPWEFGGPKSAASQYYGSEIKASFGREEDALAIPADKKGNIKYNISQYPAMMNVWSAPSNWGLFLNGNELVTTNSNTPSFIGPKGGLDGYYIGARHNAIFYGGVAETIYYDRTLTENKRAKVNSYLALKYGLTMDSDYIASDGTQMWTANNNIGYGNRITGIGRDENGALYQKQSKSQLEGANITIALGDEIKTTNAANENNIANDTSFLVFSDNDQATNFVTPTNKDEENLNRLERIYKIEKTNWQDTNITLQVDKVESASKWPLYLVISTDNQFDTNDSFHQLTDGKVTLNSSAFADGDYFTIAAPVPVPASATIEQTEVEGNKITLTFDEEVELGSPESTGFTITVGGSLIDLQEADFAVDSLDKKKLIITLPNGTNVTDKIVNVSYNGTGNLKGTNGVPVGSFEKVADDPFAAALTIAEPSTDPVTTAKPIISGTVEAGSVVTITIKDKDGDIVENAGGPATIEGGTWRFTPSVDLADGDYTIEVTATNSGKIATKTKNITITAVDKTALQTKVTDINVENLDENAYTAESWQALQDELSKAQAILNNANATQQEVNEALADLEQAHSNLVPAGTPVNKTALQTKVTDFNVENLDENAYTAESWQALQDELSKAQVVLNNANATQQEVNAALTALQSARDGLVQANDPIAITEPSSVVTTTRPAIKGFANALTTDATITIVIKDEDGNEITEAGGKAAIDDNGNWSFTPAADLPVGKYTIDATTIVDGQAVTATRHFEVKDAENRLASLVPSVGTFSPAFDPDTPSYTMSVGSSIKQLQLIPTALDPGVQISISINGGAPIAVADREISSGLPLNTGSNSIVVTVTDSLGNEQTYTITATRASDSSSSDADSSGGGGSGGAATPTNPTTAANSATKIIEVDVVIGGDKNVDITKVPIERTTQNDGRITDKVTFTPEKAKEAVAKAEAAGEQIARIVIPDANDEVSEVNVEIPTATVEELLASGIDLEIYTDNAIIHVPNSSLEGINGDFYFHLVPVKEENERREIEDRARVEQVVRVVAGNEDIEVVARPMTIETNLSSRPVTLTLPLRDVNLPTNPSEREAYLAQLGIFIEHSDGEKEVVVGEVVTLADGTLGLRFSIEKFSTFTIIHFDQENLHKAFIKGFPDGTFKPNEAVTRAQLAAMIARHLGYDKRAQFASVPFEDVVMEHYGYNPISFVSEVGIMTGDDTGNFRPNDSITRAEMVTVIVNYKKITTPQNNTVSFNDTKGHWAQWTIEAVRNEGLINGYEDGTFRPNGKLTRAESTVLLNKMFDRGPLYGINGSNFPDVPSSHWAFHHIEEAARDHIYQIDKNKREQYLK